MAETAAMDPQGEVFNFAQYLLDCNVGHPARLAYVDDQRALHYGALAHHVRAVAAALQASGVRREERVFLLMHDCIDWPCAFLGAMHCGSVPVAANTLLKAEDYAYMLAKSRSQLAVVSQALLPVFLEAMALGPHELRQVVVSRAVKPLPEGCVAIEDWLAPPPALALCAPTHPQDPGFWLFSSGSTGRPKATVHSHANPYWTAKLYGQDVLALHAGDVCFSAAKLFFAYGLGNALTFPLSVGATTVLMAERPTPPSARRRGRTQAQRVFRCSYVVCGHAGVACFACGQGCGVTPGVLGGRGLACGYRPALQSTFRGGHH